MVASAVEVYEDLAPCRRRRTASTADPAPVDDQLIINIVEEYGPSLRTYLSRWLRSPHDVEDLLQDVFIRVMNYPNLSTVESTKAFVFIVAANLLKDRNRRSYTKAAKLTTTIDNVELAAETSDPVRVLQGQEDLAKLSRTLDKLKPNTKKAFLLHRLDGHSHKEIALQMRVTTSMVEKHIMEGLKQLRLAFAT